MHDLIILFVAGSDTQLAGLSGRLLSIIISAASKDYVADFAIGAATKAELEVGGIDEGDSDRADVRFLPCGEGFGKGHAEPCGGEEIDGKMHLDEGECLL